MKKLTLIAILVAMFGIPSREEEGMWIPMLLGQMNARHMQDLGLKLNADDIYSINHSSLKDAIVQFGGGCTGVIVSGEGLLLTNHHCGLSAIQRLSSLDHDYLSDGFWAASFEQELPCQGLSVTRLVRMEDVTARVLEGVTDQMNLFQREQVIRLHVSILEKSASENGRFETKVRPFFYGNQYYLFVNEIFKDIRLVGAPPAGIGKFGGDTDNWMWPRHTGDFSVFRIYTSADGNPSPYSSGNVPYRPARFLPVSMKGYREGDFTFIFGYPGTTKEYLTSYGVDLVANQENPIKVALRGKRLDIIKAAMESDRLVRIQYAAKANGIANYWKKMMGESSGIRRIDALTTKQEYEARFRMWAAGEEARRSRYGEVLDALQKAYSELLTPDRVSIYLQEAGQGIELVRFAAGFRTLAEVCRKQPAVADDVDKALQSLKRSAGEFYRNYQPEVDCRIMAEMLEELITNLSGHDRPPVLESMAGKNHEDIQAYSHRIFRESMFADSIRLYRFLDEFRANRVTRMEKDPAYRLMNGIYEFQEKEVTPAVTRITRRIDSLQRIYMAGQMEMQPDRAFYPDANSTLRVAYGKVADYSPADAVRYNYYTTLAGVIQKEDTTILDYRVSDRLKELFRKGEYGPYGDPDGTLHVAFIASNHTTGGNSGSPVLNGNGELIGLNFDRNWEGTLSDLKYDPDQCRNISLDIRYCLFIIDRYAGCRRLVDEMTLVYP